MQNEFQCAVCSESARGVHFGVFTCEGCKSFFGRTCMKRKQDQFECRNNGMCDVNGSNRTSCKSCRFQKCIRVGMSPLNSRFGRRSKYFKVSLQENLPSTSSPSLPSFTSHPPSSFPTLFPPLIPPSTLSFPLHSLAVSPSLPLFPLMLSHILQLYTMHHNHLSLS